MMYIMIIFKLDEMLKLRGKSRYWLSKQTNIDNNTLSKIYSNEAKQIRLETLEKLTNALECNVSDLLYKVEDNEEKVEE